MTDEVKIKITLDSGEAKKGAADLSNSLRGVANTASSAGSSASSSFGGLGSVMKSVGSGGMSSISGLLGPIGLVITAITAAVGIFSALKTGISEAAAKQKEVQLLANALNVVGTATAGALGRFQDFADAVEKNSPFSSEEVLKVATYATQLGFTEAQTQKLISASADLAASQGTSLDAAFQKINGTLQGTAGSLGKQISAIKELTVEQLKAGAAVDIVSTKFAGSASQASKTFAGSLDQIKIRFDDVLKSFGAAVVNSPAIQQAFLDLIPALEAVLKVATPVASAIGSVASFVGKSITSISNAVTAFDSLAFKTDALRGKVEGLQEAYKNDPSEENLKKLKKEEQALTDLTKQYEAAELARNKPTTGTQATTVPTSNVTFGTGSTDEQKNINENLRKQLAANAEIMASAAEAVPFEQKAALNGFLSPEDFASLQEIQAEQFAAQQEAKLIQEESRIAAIDNVEQQKLEMALVKQQQELEAEKFTADQKVKLTQDTVSKQQKIKEAEAKVNERLEKAKYQAAAGFADLALAATGDNAYAAIAFQKAVAISQIAIDDSKARQAARVASYLLGPYLADGWYGTQLGLITAGTSLAVGGVVASGIAQGIRADKSSKNFAMGGIVGGSSISGDQISANLNAKEVVMNTQMQFDLWNYLRNGLGGPGIGLLMPVFERIATGIESQDRSLSINGIKLNRELDDERSNFLA